MKLETLARLLEATPTGRTCGRMTPQGPCQIIGLEPSGRCYLHGASAPHGPRRPSCVKPTTKERKALQARIAKRLQELGIIPDPLVGMPPIWTYWINPISRRFMDQISHAPNRY